MPLTIRTLLLTITLFTFTIYGRAATFVVTSTSDSGPGTLRDAISQAAANGTSTTDYIYFNLSDVSLTGRMIDLQDELPALTSNLVIDGTTQPGSPFYVTDAKVFIRKMDYADAFSMLKVYNSTNIKIYGLYLYYGDWQIIFSMTQFRQHTLYGIDISNSSNIEIGAPGKGNVINGEATGIRSFDNTSLCHDITIRSNFIGTGLYDPNGINDVDNFMIEMEIAISFLNVKNITIGGPTAAEGNVLSPTAGVWISSYSPTGNGSILIQNDHFARGYDKTTLSTGQISDAYINIGQGNQPLDYSLQLLDNDIPAMFTLQNLSAYFTMKRNRVGETEMGFFDQAKTLITNCTAGGMIGGDDPADANHFLFGNQLGFSIHTSDSGPITNIKNVYECNSDYGSTTWNGLVYTYYLIPVVQVDQPTPGAVSGTATPNCRIDLYYDDECTACEGKIYIGKVSSDASGNWSYNGPVNGTVVATATDASGRTGDFSAPRFFTGNMKIIEPSCGNANGSITGITSDGAESFYWKNLTTGTIASNAIDLTNAPPGEYVLFGVHGGTCIKPIGQSISLADLTPHIESNSVSVTQPGCGKFNGSITVTLSEYTNVKFFWVNDQGQTISNQSWLSDAGPGRYKLIIKDSVTDCSDETGFYDLVNQSGPSIDINQARVTGTTCHLSTGSIDNIQITNITGQPSYGWIDSAGKTVGTSPGLENVPAGLYNLQFKDQGTCDMITTPGIRIPNTGGDILLKADKLITASETCERKNASVQVLHISPTDAGFAFSWIDSSTDQIIGNGTSIAELSAGKYYFQAIDNSGCKQLVDSFHLIDYPGPQITPAGAIVSADICSQQTGSITGMNIQGATPLTFSWHDANGNIVSNAKDLTGQGKGSYYLVVNDVNNCSATGSAILIDNTTETLNAPLYDDLIVEKGAPAVLAVKEHEEGTYELYAMDASGGQAPNHIQKSTSGQFTTTLLDRDTTVFVILRKGDCSSPVTSINIKVLLTLELLIPNAFTPNGDGHNDIFRIKNPGLIKTLSMNIFDRWGQKIFESADPYKGWDGSFNGRPLPGGTYVWNIHYTDLLGNSHDRRGTVILLH